MPTFFSAIWNDPVWSQVIASSIWAGIASLAILISGKAKNDRFPMSKILNVKIPSWICFSGIIIMLVVNALTPQAFIWLGLSLLTVMLAISILYYRRIFENKTSDGKSGEVSDHVFFNSDSAPIYSLAAHFEQNWENHAPMGERAAGEFTFREKIISITRTNKEGRVIVKIERYNGSNPYYIHKKIAIVGKRFIIVNFEAKVIGGTHKMWIVVRYAGKTNWINNAYKILEISRETWEQYVAIIPVPPTEDIEIHFEDRGLEKENTSLQIKNFTITEPDT